MQSFQEVQNIGYRLIAYKTRLRTCSTHYSSLLCNNMAAHKKPEHDESLEVQIIQAKEIIIGSKKRAYQWE